MDTSKLFFKGYASHELDRIGELFKIKTGKEPNAFVIRPNFVVSGSTENYYKIVMSRTCACNCVMVPTELTKVELENIYSSMSEYRSRENETIDPELSECWDDDLTRHCKYCSQSFRAKDWNDFKMICDKPECIEREKNRLNEAEKIKISYPQEINVEDKAELIASIIDDEDDNYSDTIAGWVYLIQADNDLCKIGHTDNVQIRFSNLATMNAAGLSLRHTIYAINRMNAESWLHKQFRNKRHHGEWFRLTNEDIAWISDLKDGALDGI